MKSNNSISGFEVSCGALLAPCWCQECDEELNEGHLACDEVAEPEIKDRLLTLEKEGKIFRGYYNCGWEWEVVED